MSTGLSGAVAIVTGAAQGLGRGMAQDLARRGAHVVVADLQEDKAEEAASAIRKAGHRAEAMRLDIGDSHSVDGTYARVVESHGRLDCAIHNAGVGQHVAPIADLTDAEWQRVTNITLTGTFYCCRAAARIMEKQDRGSIVNIASINGQSPAAWVAAYNAAKAGVISLTRTLALELAACGVRVNAVCPGPVYTEFNRTVMSERRQTLNLSEEQMVERIRNSIPLGRWGEPGDIANAVAFLLGPEAGWMTGEVVRVSGGLEGVAAAPGKADEVTRTPTIGICGAGQMGAAAAVAFRRAGYATVLWVRAAQRVPTVRRTLAGLERWMDRNVGRATEKAAPIEVTGALGRIDREADLVMDAIAEDMAAKVALFRQLANARSRNAIFITTTSGLSVTKLARKSRIGPRLVGTHFWNPPHLMPLVEVVRGEDTAEETIEAVVDLIRAIGKIPVRVNRDVPGFIGNRLLHALWREAINLVERGIASPEDIDRVARLTFGLRLAAVGPLENMDLVGLDLIEVIHKYLLADLCQAKKPLPALAKLVAAGKLGMKSGEGFHHWSARDRAKLIDRRDRQIVRQLAFLTEIDAL